MIPTRTVDNRSPLPRAARTLALALGTALAVAGWALVAGPGVAAAQDGSGATSCVECHSDPKFLVQNKKLYDYYQGWQVSAHNQAGVTCVDCHGGDPEAEGKREAHGGAAMSASAESSPINFRNVPATCAQCHDDIYSKFKESEHFAKLQAHDTEQRGPNCVTCHGSVNTSVLTVNTVRTTCEQCHNERSDLHPEIPAKAEEVLSNFLSIHRYYRGITLRGEAEEVQSFFRVVDPVIERLAAEWHTFDLDAVEQQTHDLLLLLKEKRNELMREQKGRTRS